MRLLDEVLRKSGVRTFLDERDLLPGDKIVDRIFREGISGSDVVIVVLSLNSIDRPWVKEELDAAIVQRIAGRVKKIIPVVLDGVTPPDALAATVWERATDLSDPSRHFRRILDAIFGVQEVPMGAPPAYAATPLSGLGLHVTDEHVLKIAGDMRLKQDRDPTISVHQLWLQAQELGISEEAFGDALFSLNKSAFLTDLYGESGTRWPIAFRLSSYGFESYLRGYQQGTYERARRDIVAAIVNNDASSASDLRKITGFASAIVEWVIDDLECNDYLRVVHAMGESIRFAVVGPLRRLLENLSQ